MLKKVHLLILKWNLSFFIRLNNFKIQLIDKINLRLNRKCWDWIPKTISRSRAVTFIKDGFTRLLNLFWNKYNNRFMSRCVTIGIFFFRCQKQEVQRGPTTFSNLPAKPQTQPKFTSSSGKLISNEAGQPTSCTKIKNSSEKCICNKSK